MGQTVKKKTVMGEMQRNSMEHWKGRPKRQKPIEQETKEMGLARDRWQRTP